jgi:dihydrofolate reductase
MAKLIYSTICSLDEYVEDAGGKFDWARPDDELLALVNDQERPIGTYLYGRRMYETMQYWETAAAGGPLVQEYAEIWRAADKVVYSRTLETASTERTRVERDFDAAAVAALKQSSGSDLTIGGADLAGQALAAGLVDECHLFVHPIVVGGGKRALPDGVKVELEIVDERRLTSGVVHLHYRVCN